ncbi:glutathione S-transferase family protein [Burkholderia humptydooensis MSMB43]|uniref:Glutathione S-transferase family protein n=1 Tax=Burkholderia humptydooensis MSMB43 TaxID=441157 RepID=A0ABN0G2L2_9BURK|nr:glutathione S-transferase family protein [Burkholderia humptydooensis MSMB43]
MIGTYFSPFARRVGVALNVLDIGFEHDPLNGYTEAARADLLNPVGKVPVLELDDGTRLIDSGAILDFLDERVGPERALAPRFGAPRQAMLQLAAIATTIYEKTTARYAEEHRADNGTQADLIDRYRTQTLNGFTALDEVVRSGGPIRSTALNLATITAVVAYDYAQATHPDLDLGSHARALSAVAASVADHPAFARTRP